MQTAVFLTIGLAIVGQVISYAVAVAFARSLGISGFEIYAFAAAVFMILVAIAPVGIEKYSLRLLPALLERRDWSTARGFLSFAVRRTLLTSVIVAVLGLVGVLLWRDASSTMRIALAFACLAVPAAALTHLGLEILAAVGKEVLSATMLRVLLPIAVLLTFLGLSAAFAGPTAPLAVAAWAVVWVVAIPFLVLKIRSTMPRSVLSVAIAAAEPQWTRDAMVFWIHRIAVTSMAQMSIIVLELMTVSMVTVASYAAALATAAPAVAVVAATNRIYARRLAIELERRDGVRLAELRIGRLRWVVPVVATFVLAMFVFAPEIMSLFGPEFVAEGTWPLRILAAAAGITMVFGLAPTYLKFTQQRSIVTTANVVAGAVQMGLLVLLIPRFGAIGASLAHATATIGLYSVLALTTLCHAQRAPEHS